jgi:hypothetical protein
VRFWFLLSPAKTAQTEVCATGAVQFNGGIVAFQIDVEKTGELKFRVRVAESGSETTHEVTVSANDYAKLTAGKIEPEELVRKSFEFLIEHEPKESILRRFDLSAISRYFPEYEREMKRSLSNSK